jgi:hypothetical protein
VEEAVSVKEAGKEMNTRLLAHKRASTLVAVVVCAFAAAGVQAQIVQMAGNVGATPTYQGDPTFEWNVPSADLNDGSAIGVGFWSIAPSWGAFGPADFTWTGNALDQDLSSGGIADGTFQSGGVLSINGALHNGVFPGSPLIHNGLLFVADVGSFQVQELESGDNKLHLIGTILLIPTAGYLYDQGYLAPAYEMSFQAVSAQQMLPPPDVGVGPLNDFQTDIITITQMQYTMVAVPEPVSALMVFIGGLALIARRKR